MTTKPREDRGFLVEYIRMYTSQLPLTEDYVRGVPDFALTQLASECAEGLKRHLKRNIQMVAADPVRQRQMLAATRDVLDKVEEEVKRVLEDCLESFINNT